MPAYNAGSYIQNAIQSVFDQYFKDFELIVVDDGSTDNTADIVKGFLDERLVYVYQENAERSAARNRGLDIAKGNYVAFLDADDRYLPNKLASQVKALDLLPQAGLVASGFNYIDAKGQVLSTYTPWTSYPNLDFVTWLYACPVWLPHILIRKIWLEQMDGFDVNMSYAEDYDLFLRLAFAGCKMEWIKEIVCDYRLHGENSIHQTERMTQGNIYSINKIFNDTNLPCEIKSHYPKVMQRVYLNAALRAFGSKDFMTGNAYLEKSYSFLEITPINVKKLAIEIGENACNRTLTKSPIGFINTIWEHLPIQLDLLKGMLKIARATAARQLFFEAFNRRDKGNEKKMFLTVLKNNIWDIDRGMLSVLIKELIGEFN